MDTGTYIAMLAAIGAFFAVMILWMSRQVRRFDQKYGKDRSPAD